MANRKCALCPWVGQLRRGWCEKHYRHWKAHGDPLYERPRATVCAVEGCGRSLPEPGAARGWCRKHYLCWQRNGDPEAASYCQGCGVKINAGFRFCTRKPECRRLGKGYQRAKDPERTRASRALWRAKNPEKVRAAVARYKARTDRICVRPKCSEYAIPGMAYCRGHSRERGHRRYERIRLKLPLRLHERQSGMCPDTAHGGCGLPLAEADGNNVDHLIPKARGGPDDDWNLQLMHPWCNQRKVDTLVPGAAILAAQHGIILRLPKRS